MEERDGFLTMTRHKIEAAVKTNGLPGIMIAHSVRNMLYLFSLLPFIWICSSHIVLTAQRTKMGNSVFRYFQEWLRVQLREEAYSRYVHDAEEAAAVRAAMAAGATDGVPPRGPFWRGRAWVRHHLPGRVSDDGMEHAFSTFLEEYDDVDLQPQKDHDKEKISSIYNENKDDNQPKDSKRKYPKLWELAKIDGDRDFIDWLGKHIWTYVGLAAPLLGAPGPLRSVISGENMGLPFTDEEARTLELCKYITCSFTHQFTQ